MYGCECWTVKKAEYWRIPGFRLWCWRRILRVHWTTRRSNQSVLKEIIPEYFLEGLMLKLKFQYFGHMMQRTYSLEKTLMLGNTEGKKRRGRQKMRWLDSVTKSMDMNLSTALRAAVHVVTKNQIWLTNWTTRRNWTPLTLSSYLVGAAAAAKSLQSCTTLCNPICGSPPGSSIPGIFQEWVAVSFFYLVALENKRKNVHFFWPSDYIINAFCW